MPAGLRDRLGKEASHGLLELLDCSQREWKADVIGASTERFERRLVEETATLRVQIAHVESSLRQEMAAMRADLRQGVAAMGADLRQDMSVMSASLRQEAALNRVELFKWCFLFWIGQVLAITGIMSVMLRLYRP